MTDCLSRRCLGAWRTEEEEKYVRLVWNMYEGVEAKVRSCVGVKESFTSGVSLHQRLALSPYLFDFLMDVLVADIKEQALWSILFADDIVLVDEARRGS